MIWHQSICQNSKHSREAENTVLLDAKKFLGDIDSITMNATSTNVSDHLAGYKKLKLCDECRDQLLLSGEPNSAYIGILSTGGLKNLGVHRIVIFAEAEYSAECSLPKPNILPNIRHAE